MMIATSRVADRRDAVPLDPWVKSMAARQRSGIAVVSKLINRRLDTID
jgi:hypothetical protein